MNQLIRTEALRCFKSLHKARKDVFAGDEYALSFSRNKINEEFRKNKNVTDKTAIEELIKHCKEIENELRTRVIQAKEVEPGKYRLHIRPETEKLENVPFTDHPCSKT